MAAARRAFSAATESATWQQGRAQDSDSEEEEVEEREGGGGYSDTESQYEDMAIVSELATPPGWLKSQGLPHKMHISTMYVYIYTFTTYVYIYIIKTSVRHIYLGGE